MKEVSVRKKGAKKRASPGSRERERGRERGKRENEGAVRVRERERERKICGLWLLFYSSRVLTAL